jgi:hypothetical protein
MYLRFAPHARISKWMCGGEGEGASVTRCRTHLALCIYLRFARKGGGQCGCVVVKGWVQLPNILALWGMGSVTDVLRGKISVQSKSKSKGVCWVTL